jgi:hypothetical protein
MMFVYIIGFLFLVSDLTKCTSGKKEDVIHSTGKCELPGVLADGSIMEKKKSTGEVETQCLLYVRPGSWHRVSLDGSYYSCAINGYDFVGTQGKYKAMVGRGDWFLPIWKEEDSCIVFLSSDVWEKARKVEPNKIVGGILSHSSTSDESYKIVRNKIPGRYEEHMIIRGIAYPDSVMTQEKLRLFLTQVANEISAKIIGYHGAAEEFKMRLTLYQKVRADGTLDIPICSLSSDNEKTMDVTCNEDSLTFIANSSATVLMMSPERRKEIFDSLVEARFNVAWGKHESLRSISGKGILYVDQDRDELRSQAIFVDVDDEEFLKTFRARNKINKEQLSYVKVEGDYLGWKKDLVEARDRKK